MGLSERALIERIGRIAVTRPPVIVGIGDDAAVIDAVPLQLIAHDMLVEDVHFRRQTTSWADLGHKALAVNLSDIAAMGGTPTAALVGLALPDDGVRELVDELYSGMEALAAEHGVTVAGGDLTRSATLVVGVTAVGVMDAGVAPVLRSGAAPGDLVCVTGRLGAAAAGLLRLDGVTGPTPHDDLLRDAHRRPVPRVSAGRKLARAGATAMLDCSDGLGLDVARLALASQVAVTIELDAVPVATGVDAVALAAGRAPDEFAATGGEDYELIVTLPPQSYDDAAQGLGLPLTVVGTVARGEPGVRFLRGGRPVELRHLGWEH